MPKVVLRVMVVKSEIAIEVVISLEIEPPEPYDDNGMSLKSGHVDLPGRVITIG